jgi:tape measure domain-containing protein
VDITTVSRVILTAEDKTAPGFDSAQGRAKKTGDVLDQLTKMYGAEAAAAIKAGMDAEKAFAGQLAAMQRTRAELRNMQSQLDSLGSGNRDIARMILGTRGSYEIQNEIKLINSALESLRKNAANSPLELERAAAAATAKLKVLRAELGSIPTEAQKAAAQIQSAFGALGIRGAAQIAADIQAINAALNTLRTSGSAGPAELARAAEAARVRIAALRQEMGNLSPEVTRAQQAFNSLGIRSAAQINNEIKAIQTTLQALTRDPSVTNNEMARAFEAARVKVEALKKELNGVPEKLNQVSNAAKPLAGEFAHVGAAVSPLPGLMRGMIAPLVAIASFEGIRRITGDLIGMADANTLLQARLKAVTGSVEGGRAAFAGLSADARRLRAPIEEVGHSFTRIATAIQGLGGSIGQARQLNEIVIATAKITGAFGFEAAASARQFAQALGSGVLQGDELRSILENNQELARQLAAGLGVSVGELKKLGAEGKLTADVVSSALLSRLAEIQRKLKDVPITVADGWTLLKNELFETTAVADKASGASGFLANKLEGIAIGLKLIREQFADGQIIKGIGSILALGTMSFDNLRYQSGEREKEAQAQLASNQSPAETARLASAARAQEAALGVIASAKRLNDEAGKALLDFGSKQDKITHDFQENMKKIAASILAQKKIIEVSPVGSDDSSAALKEVERLQKGLADGTAKYRKEIAEANLADLKKTGILKEHLRALKSTLETIKNAGDSAKEGLDGLFDTDGITKAEVALRKLRNSDAWTKLTAEEQAYAIKQAEIAADMERLTASMKAQFEAAGKYAGDRAKEYAEWEKEVAKAAESVDMLVEKLEAEAKALRSAGVETNEQAQALLRLNQQLDDGLMSYDDYILRVERLNAAFKNRDTAKLEDDTRKKVIKENEDAAKELFSFIDKAATEVWGAMSDKAGNAWQKIRDTFKSTVMAAIYKMAVQPLVFNIVANISGMAAPASGGVAGALMGGKGSGGIDYGGIISNASSFFGSPGSSFLAALGGSEALGLAGTAAGAALGAGFSAGVATLTIAAEAGVAAIGGMSAAMGAMAAVAVPVIGWIAAAAMIAYAIFSKPGGGPKAGGNATIGNVAGMTGTDDSGMRWFTPNQTDAELQKTITTANKSYGDIVKALGLTKQDVGFALGFDTDPQGTAPNRTHAGTFVNGVQVYDSAQSDLGRDEKKLQDQLALESKRIIFAALKASLGDAPDYMKQLFEGVDVMTVTSEEIDEILGLATALKLIVDTMGKMGERFAALDIDQMKDLVEQFGGLQNFLAAAQFMNANFTTVAEQRLKAEENVLKAFKDAGYELPKTHAEFLALTESLDLTTEEGRKAYATLVQLAPAFIALNGTAEQAAQKVIELDAAIHEFNLDNMITTAERLATDTNELNATFADLGVGVPATHAEFLALIGTLALTQEEALALSQLYVRVSGTAQEAAEAEEALNDARLEAIATAEEFYRSKFFTGPEQAAARIASAWIKVHQAWAAMGTQLLALGLDHIPTTNEGFRALIESIDRATPAGQALYEQLILLAPTIFDLNESVDELGGTAGATAEELQRLRDNLREFLDSLKIGDLSPLTPEQKLLEAQQQYQRTLAAAQGGDADALGKLPQVAQEYLTLARDFFASSQQYTDIFNAVVAALEPLASQPGAKPPTTDLSPLNAVLPNGKKLASDQDIEELANRIIDRLAQNSRDNVEVTTRTSRRVADTVEETGKKPPRGTR